MTITTAKISFSDNGTPLSRTFDDVYFSQDNGLAETEYVFLQNNNLPNRWYNWEKRHFVIAEMGFGTGLNFLAVANLFLKFRTEHPNHPLKQLHFQSIEKFPLEKPDLAKALKSWEQLSKESEELIAHYPILISGCHRMNLFDGRITLDLWFGDVLEVLPQWRQQEEAAVDCWFLDGFAPSKNPEMWTPELFNHMGRISSVEGTFATFTAAGFVKRGLQDAGFEVVKKPGFGRKREMLTGVLKESSEARTAPLFYGPWYRNSCNKQTPTAPSVAVIGGGMAGANALAALSRAGFRATLYEQSNKLASGASGNIQGGFYPHLTADFSLQSQIYALCFDYASKFYQAALNQGANFTFDRCGALLTAFSDAVGERQNSFIQNQAWPKELAYPVTVSEAEEIAGLPLKQSAIYFPNGGWINPAELVNALVEIASKAGSIEVSLNHQLRRLEKNNASWKLHFSDGSICEHDIVLLTNAHNVGELPQCSQLPLSPVRGQVERVASNPMLRQLKTVLCHKGYFTPSFENFHAMGSTYSKKDDSCDFRMEDEESNLSVLKKSFIDCAWVNSVTLAQNGRASIRCSTPDRLPIMGAVPNQLEQKAQYEDLYKALPENHYPMAEDHSNLYILAGLGSRGLCTAPLLAEAIVCQIAGKPLPFNQQQLAALNPNRFLIRDLIRRKV